MEIKIEYLYTREVKDCTLSRLDLNENLQLCIFSFVFPHLTLQVQEARCSVVSY